VHGFSDQLSKRFVAVLSKVQNEMDKIVERQIIVLYSQQHLHFGIIKHSTVINKYFSFLNLCLKNLLSL
jgi:hypothetical protein